MHYVLKCQKFATTSSTTNNNNNNNNNESLSTEQQLFVTICAGNCREWIVSDIASVLYDFVLVPVHTTVEIATTEFVMQQTDTAVFIGSRDALEKNASSIIASKTIRLVICTEIDSSKIDIALLFIS